MSIEISCKCGSAYRLEDHRSGQEFICKVCGTTMRLPATGSSEAPVATATVPAPEPAATATEHPPVPTSWSATAATREATTPETATPEAATPEMISWTPVSQPDCPPQPEPLQRDAAPWQKVVRHPPAGWWIVRLVMLGMCVGFLFLPWFTASAQNPFTKKTESQSLTGWQIMNAVIDGIREASRSPEVVPGFTDVDVPKGAGAIVAGGLMMTGGPCVFAGGLLLAVILIWVIYKHDGKGAGWPFAICWLALMAFIIGWHLVAQSSPMGEMLSQMHKMGFSVGVSPWAYLMLFILVPMTLIARMRPDHLLARTKQ